VTFLSSDSILFKVHRKNIEFLSEGFAAPAMTITNGEVIPLAEMAEVLELLFQFMYPQRHPDLKTVEFKTLNGLAEAVEKYQVYPALQMCKLFMAAEIPQHGIEVLEYAAKHMYTDLLQEACTAAVVSHPLRVLECAMKEGLRDLMDLAAEELLATPFKLQDAARVFSHRSLVIWLQYYGQWLDLLHKVQKFTPGREGSWQVECCRLRDVANIHHYLSGNPGLLRDIDAAFNRTEHETSRDTVPQWKEDVCRMKAELKPFSAFLDLA